MSSTYYAPFSNNPNNIRWSVQMIKLHVRQFSVLCSYFLLLVFPEKSGVLCCANHSSHYWIPQIKNICTVHVCKVVKYSASHFAVTDALSLLLRTPLAQPTIRSYHKPEWQYLQLCLLLYCITTYIVVKIIWIAWKLNQPCGKECN